MRGAGWIAIGSMLVLASACALSFTDYPSGLGGSGGTTSGSSSSGGPSSSTSTSTSSTGATDGGGPDAGAPAVTLTPSALQDFGTIVDGLSSGDTMFTVQNTGTAPTTAAVNVTLGGADAAQFILDANTCTAVLAASASCTFNVKFTPGASAPAGLKQGTVTATAGGSLTATTSLQGTAAAQNPNLSLTAVTAASFGNVEFGVTSAALVFQLKNTGNVATGVPGAPQLTGTNASDFGVSNNGCTAALAPNGACNISLTFTPSMVPVGPETASLGVTASPGGMAALAVSGKGTNALTLTGPTTDFGSVYVGVQSSALAFTVTNTGAVASGTPSIALTGGTGDFAQTSTCTAGIAAGGTCTVNVTVNASGVGARSATLNVSATPGGAAAVVGVTATAAPAPSCDLNAPFGAPTLVPGVNTTSNESFPRLSPDELTMYFTSNRPGGSGGYDIWVATRSNRTASFGAPVPLAGVNTSSDDDTPSVSPDQLTIVFRSTRSGTAHIWSATRAAVSLPFGNVAMVTGIQSTGQYEADPFVRSDGQQLLFSSTRPGSGGSSGARALWSAAGSGVSFANPVPLTELNSTGEQIYPALTSDGLTIFWATTRTTPGIGDIWTASRASTSAPFTGLRAVAELNTPATDDVPGSLSPDACRIYLSNTLGTVGGYDIYVAERPAYSDMTKASNWSTFDTTTVNPGAKGFQGATFDGRYLYLSPSDNGARDGIVAQYDTHAAFTATGSWTTFDTTTVNAGAMSYAGTVFDGRYVYFVGNDNGGFDGVIARYDSQAPFGSTSSWSTFDASTVNSSAVGFAGAVFDGRFLYFASYYGNGTIARYDTQGSFTASSSWTAFNCGASGFVGAVFDGRYVYFVPQGDTDFTVSSVMVRYDTQGSFASTASWTTLDLTTINAKAKGYAGAAFDGRYIYLAPYVAAIGPVVSNGNVARYDTQATFTSAPSWTFFDTTTVTPGAEGFQHAAFDGRYIYFVPYGNSTGIDGLLVRYDTWAPFTMAGSWSSFDTTTVNTGAKGFLGAAFDGRYLYLVPNYNVSPDGIVARFDAKQPSILPRLCSSASALYCNSGSFY